MLTALSGCYMAAVSARSVYTIQPCTKRLHNLEVGHYMEEEEEPSNFEKTRYLQKVCTGQVHNHTLITIYIIIVFTIYIIL